MEENQRLLHASAAGDLETVRALLTEGAVDIETRDEDGKTPVCCASQSGHVGVVELLLACGADPNSGDNERVTPVHLASAYGHVEIVKLLLKSGADPNAANETGSTPLIAASWDGHVEAVKVLLEAGADPLAVDKSGWTPLKSASRNGHAQVAEVLLKAGADPNAANENGSVPLHSALAHVEVVQVLLEAGADPLVADMDGSTLLHMASTDGHVDVVEVLLKAGADPNVVTETGWTPLISASGSGHVEVVKMLLEAGADPLTVDKSGWRPLNSVSDSGRRELVKLIMEGGAGPKIGKKNGSTPLSMASSKGYVEVVEVLLKTGIDPNVVDDADETPFYRACTNGHVGVVEMLLKAGADPNLVNPDGRAPLRTASSNGHVEAVDVLLKAGADPNLTDNDGYTPLFLASGSGHTNVIKMLLKAGADPQITNKSMETPLHVASRGHKEVVEMLLMAGGDPQAADKRGSHPLLIAAKFGRVEVVKTLLKAGADPRVTNTIGEAPLLSAAKSNCTEAVELLLRAGADPNHADTNKWTALHYACQGRASEIAQVLLSYGSEIHAEDNEGLEPFHLCVTMPGFTMGSLTPVRLLVSFGATWDAKCDEIASRDDRVGIQALRECVLTWAQEYRDGLSLTPVDGKTIRRGPQHTRTYINELKNSKEIKYRRKICVVGPSKAGKTTLVKSLTSREPSLVHPDDRTIGVDQILLRFGVENPGEKTRIHEVTFWDFAGQDEYQVAHSLFFSARTLYLVCVDLEALLVAYMQAELMGHSKKQCEQLMNEFIERDILRWVRLIFSHQPDAEFVFIATKDDLLAEFPEFTKEIKAFLAMKLEQVEGIAGEMKREVVEHVKEGERRADALTIHAYNKRMEERHNSEVDDTSWEEVECDVAADDADAYTTNLWDKFTWNCRAYQQLVSTVKSRTGTSDSTSVKPAENVVKVLPRDPVKTIKQESLFVSCSDVKSVERARAAIIELIVTSGRSFVMPDSYTNVLNAVAEMREAAAKGTLEGRVAEMITPVDSLVETLVIKTYELEKRAETERLKEMEEQGKAEAMQKMEKTQMMSKNTCITILQALHDLGDVLWYENLGIELFQKSVILDPLLLIDFVRQVINHNNKSEKLAHGELKGLPFWSSLADDKTQYLALKQVLQNFQLVYPTQGEMRWNSDLIVPSFWKSKTPASWLFGYEDVRLDPTLLSRDLNQPEEQVRVHWEYHFAHEFPDALFDHLVVDTYSPYMDRDAGPDWIMYSNDGIFACRAMVSRDTKTVNRVLQLEAVLAKTANETETEELWTAFEYLSKGIVNVLRRYRGLVVTAVALDKQKRMSDLETLFDFPLEGNARSWMPRVKSWELYKRVVGSCGNVNH